MHALASSVVPLARSLRGPHWQAAERYAAGLQAGIGAEVLVALELGAQSPGELTEMQQQYIDKLRLKLEQVRRVYFSLSPYMYIYTYICM